MSRHAKTRRYGDTTIGIMGIRRGYKAKEKRKRRREIERKRKSNIQTSPK
jgi:hypothetical protein